MSNKENTIRDEVDPNSIKGKIAEGLAKEDHAVAQLVKLGTELLKESEKPNIITVKEFEPFIPLFKVDNERLDQNSKRYDRAYDMEIRRLYNEYVHGLGINLYQPTIVIESRENPVELVFLNRAFTRVKSDAVEGNSARAAIPASVLRNPTMTRDQAILDASLSDLQKANQSPEQKEAFVKAKIESALFNHLFFENNLSPEKKAEILESANPAEETPTQSSDSSDIEFTLDDD